jgi:putative intracellular protease/amidase
VVKEKGTLRLPADAALAEVPQPDVIVLPGGPGQNAHMADGTLRRWLRATDEHSTWTNSVCTGSLRLASAALIARASLPLASGKRRVSSRRCADESHLCDVARPLDTDLY